MSSITLFNSMGDVILTWDKENEETIIRYIEAKMKKGYTFFLIEKKDGIDVLTPTTNIERMKEAKTVRMGEDEDPLIDAGTVQLARQTDPSRTEQLGPPVKNARDVVKNDTVAVKRIVGG